MTHKCKYIVFSCGNMKVVLLYPKLYNCMNNLNRHQAPLQTMHVLLLQINATSFLVINQYLTTPGLAPILQVLLNYNGSVLYGLVNPSSNPPAKIVSLQYGFPLTLG